MGSVELSQVGQRVLEDFTERTLRGFTSDYARLLYVGSLRDLAGGRYHHDGLAAVYPQSAVQEALLHCHEELFARLLERPLEEQEDDLRKCLESLDGEFLEIVRRWQDLEPFRVLVPLDVPGYLRELFYSNLRVLLAALAVAPASSARDA